MRNSAITDEKPVLLTVINTSDAPASAWKSQSSDRGARPRSVQGEQLGFPKEEQMVHLVTAVIKPFKLEEVKDALRGHRDPGDHGRRGQGSRSPGRPHRDLSGGGVHHRLPPEGPRRGAVRHAPTPTRSSTPSPTPRGPGRSATGRSGSPPSTASSESVPTNVIWRHCEQSSTHHRGAPRRDARPMRFRVTKKRLAVGAAVGATVGAGLLVAGAVPALAQETPAPGTELETAARRGRHHGPDHQPALGRHRRRAGDLHAGRLRAGRDRLLPGQARRPRGDHELRHLRPRLRRLLPRRLPADVRRLHATCCPASTTA